MVLPETFTSGFSNDAVAAAGHAGRTVDWLLEQADRLDAAVTGGMRLRDGDGVYNHMLFAAPGGGLAHYDKRHLFSFANEHERYAAGDRRVIVEIEGVAHPAAGLLRPAVFSRNRYNAARPGLPDYDLALYVANWPSVRSYAWKTLLRARAIENVSYVVGVNRVGTDGNGLHYSGDSAVIDFLGQPVSECMDAEVVATTLQAAELQAHREHFPALRDADAFNLEA